MHQSSCQVSVSTCVGYFILKIIGILFVIYYILYLVLFVLFETEWYYTILHLVYSAEWVNFFGLIVVGALLGMVCLIGMRGTVIYFNVLSIGYCTYILINLLF